jgi:hypothetical protein
MTTASFTQNQALEFAHLLAAARRCHPLWERGGRLTFPGAIDPDAAWSAWVEDLWQPVLQPALHQSLQLARSGALRELLEIDAALSEQLPDEMARRSQREARLLWQSLHPPKGERLLEKLPLAVSRRATPGHFIPCFAARAAAFSLSTQLASAAYLFFEAWPVLQGAPAVRLQEWLAEANINLPDPGARETLPLSSASES